MCKGETRHSSPSPIKLSPVNSGFGASKPKVWVVRNSCSPFKSAVNARKYELHDTAIADTMSSSPCGWIRQHPLASPLQTCVGYSKACASAYASAVNGLTRDPSGMGCPASSHREESKMCVLASNKR